MKIKTLLISTFVAVGLLAGCSEDMRLSTEEIVTNVLAAEDEIQSYYAKAELNIYEDGALNESSTIEEYRNEEGLAKVVLKDKNGDNEAISFTDGVTAISYDKKENVAYEMDVSTFDIPQRSQREQITSMLENFKESHEYQLVGDEEINEFQTHHVKLTPKEKDSLLGEMEIWVDQKTWFPIKTEITVGSTQTEVIYTEINTSPKFEEGTFTVSLPEDVEIVTFEDEMGQSSGTIEEAEAKLGIPFLVLTDKDLLINEIEIAELGGELNRTEVTISYKNKNDIPQLYLSVFPAPEEKEFAIADTGLKLRGHNAEYMKEINAYSWDENSLRYSIIVEDSASLPQEKVLEMIEEMEMSSSH